MTSDDEQLERELADAARGLTFMSESDYPVEVVRWHDVSDVTPERLRALAGEDASAPVEEVSAERVFRAMASEPDWKGAAELDTARRYQKLLRLMGERLADLKAYRVGTINVAIYVVGRTAGGDWLGVSTRSVET
ncbi:MAG TPA: nuclease A inhibitor family protein [Pyrinomonadaceae bacterium]|jgi:hypothetical protein